MPLLIFVMGICHWCSVAGRARFFSLFFLSAYLFFFNSVCTPAALVLFVSFVVTVAVDMWFLFSLLCYVCLFIYFFFFLFPFDIMFCTYFHIRNIHAVHRASGAHCSATTTSATIKCVYWTACVCVCVLRAIVCVSMQCRRCSRARVPAPPHFNIHKIFAVLFLLLLLLVATLYVHWPRLCCHFGWCCSLLLFFLFFCFTLHFISYPSMHANAVCYEFSQTEPRECAFWILRENPTIGIPAPKYKGTHQTHTRPIVNIRFYTWANIANVRWLREYEYIDTMYMQI